MSRKLNPKINSNQPMVYQIRIKGHLGPQWTDWFEGLTIKLEDDGLTLLAGPMIDQAMLHGLLRKVRDLGMPLISVNRIGRGEADGAQPIGSDANVQMQVHDTSQDSSRREGE